MDKKMLDVLLLTECFLLIMKRLHVIQKTTAFEALYTPSPEKGPENGKEELHASTA
jgi:hypothetical protein